MIIQTKEYLSRNYHKDNINLEANEKAKEGWTIHTIKYDNDYCADILFERLLEVVNSESIPFHFS